jgi:putative peptidoglycan lipid II flippase
MATATEANAAQAEAGPARPTSIGRRIAGAALILMAGTVLSRVLGLGRESTIAYLFGAGSEVDAFTIANHVATIVYDLLIAGTINAALVPVFSEYAADEQRRPEFGRVVSTVLTVAGCFLLLAVAALEVFAEPLAGFMSACYPPDTQALAITMTRWVLPGVFFMGLAGVVMAALYAMHRFAYPAFNSAVFNLAVIFGAFTLAGLLGVKSLVVGMVAGTVAMLLIQAPGLRGVPLRPALDLSHPAVRKIFKLYAPIGLSVVISSAALVIDRNLASCTGEGSISAMRYATTLVQFALGMVSAAISFAALPSLSQHFARGDLEAYKRTLAAGLRLVMVMAMPATAGLLALATPIVALAFRHGMFDVADQQLTVLALLFYAPGVPFTAIDMVLLVAFYARKNTITPVLVGVAATGVYLSVALGTYRTMGMPGLVLANTLQLTFHALATGLLLLRAMRDEGGLRGYGVGETILKAGGAAVVTGLLSYAAWWALHSFITDESLLAELLLLGVPVALGGGAYIALIWAMRLSELELIISRIKARIRRNAGSL